MSNWLLIAVVALVVFAWYAAGRGGSAHRIPSERARQLVAQGARLVDVRTRREFGKGHIPGATNVPLGELGSRVADLGSKQDPLVLYCLSGHRSALAARRLSSLGFEQVHDLGPISAW